MNKYQAEEYKIKTVELLLNEGLHFFFVAVKKTKSIFIIFLQYFTKSGTTFNPKRPLARRCRSTTTTKKTQRRQRNLHCTASYELSPNKSLKCEN